LEQVGSASKSRWQSLAKSGDYLRQVSVRPRVRGIIPPNLVFEFIEVGVFADAQKLDARDPSEILQVARS